MHRIVDSTPWLLVQPWLIQAPVIALAGAYQLTPLKQRFLVACRHPLPSPHLGRSAIRAGAEHAADCLGVSWALMLLMFGAGFANVWWMLGLTGIMVYEARGRHGNLGAYVSGAMLLILAVLALALHGLPGFEPPT